MVKKPVKYCVVDAFTNEAFKGNPAAVCLLEERDEDWLQAVASEFNEPMTCYLTRLTVSTNADSFPRFCLRWFTPVVEVKLCGHATLAASHFLFSYGLVKCDVVEFLTHSGILTARRVLLPSGDAVAEVEPQFAEVEKCPGRGILITGIAPARSRFDFYILPETGFNEDLVCGSAHCVLAPYWSKKLGKLDLIAYQASARSGVLYLHFDEKNQRVLLRRKAVAVMEGSLLV